MPFFLDVYGETDAQHHFTRHEWDLADAPARGSEIGKTRWEVPYLATLDAHLPFAISSSRGRCPTAEP